MGTLAWPEGCYKIYCNGFHAKAQSTPRKILLACFGFCANPTPVLRWTYRPIRAILLNTMEKMALTHLRALEAESIHILREVVAEFAKPVMLYSIGKDSSVMVRLAQKAFFPGKLPFPLLHIDTTYKFREMIEFRDRFTKEIGAELIVHTNRNAIENGANPFRLGTQKCCGLLKTRALLDALSEGGYDAAFGGARRDEEKS